MILEMAESFECELKDLKYPILGFSLILIQYFITKKNLLLKLVMYIVIVFERT